MEPKLLKIMQEFNRIRLADINYDTEEAFELVKQLQGYLNEKFPCDVDALSGFAEMYRQKDFKQNIDTITNEGNAEFIAQAIECYCYLA